MKLFTPFLLLLLSVAFLKSCSGKTDPEKTEAIPIDTLFVQDFEEIVTTESAQLVEPLELENVDEQHFAVLDNRLSKILVFDYSGEKKWEFGKKGSGPGEWEDVNGPADLNYQNEKFMVYNRAQLKLDFFAVSGEYIESVPLPQFMYFSNKKLLDDSTLLVTTDGNENSLATIYEMGEPVKVIKKVGKPVVEYTGAPNFENQRRTYAGGEVPDEAKNSALAIHVDSRFLIFMQTLGEIRLYNEEGKLLKSTGLPEVVKNPLFQRIAERNKNLPANTVANLSYALNMEATPEQIYILTPDFERGGNEINPHLLIYDHNLDLQKHFVLIPQDKPAFLTVFIITPDAEILFLDVENSRVLKAEMP